MKFIIGKDRNQAEFNFLSLDQQIEKDNEVRLIDAFVNSLKLEDFGFKVHFSENGRPAYHPSDLLKLFIYGYQNRIRSSRHLEKECKRNLEIKWLINDLCPDHNTISNFRKDNPLAIRKVFKSTVEIAKHFELIGGLLLAGDSTKLRAQNSKKNNYNEKKIERHLDYIEQKTTAYLAELAESDGDNKEELEKQIQKQEIQKAHYQSIEKQLHETGENQVSTSDPESRQLITRNNITEVAYNIQTTVDAKNNIPIDYLVTNKNDRQAMGEMLERAVEIIGKNDFIALYDKGYHATSEFLKAEKLGVEVMVAVPDVASHAPDYAFDIEQFRYNKEEDYYTCPDNQKLNTNHQWYKKSNGNTIVNVKHYKTTVCKSCLLKERCTKNKSGRLIERQENAELLEKNRARTEANQKLYRRRQSIVEHPFGTIKRQWGFDHVMTKRSKLSASTDVGFIFIAYNLRRIINIIGYKKLISWLTATLEKHLYTMKNRSTEPNPILQLIKNSFKKNQPVESLYGVHIFVKLGGF